MTSDQQDNIEDLLSDLKSQYHKSDTSEISQESHEIDSLLDEVKSTLKTNKMSTEDNNNPVTQNNSQVDDYLNSIKAQYQSQPSNEIGDLDQLKSQFKTNHSISDRAALPKADRNPPTKSHHSQLDDSLDSIKAQYQSQPSNEIGDLDQLKSQFKTNHSISDRAALPKADRNPPTKSHHSQVEDSLDSIKAQYQPQSSNEITEIEGIKSQLKAKRNKASQNKPQVNNHVDAIKQQYQHEQSWQKNQAELNYNRNKEEIIRQEQQKQLKHKQLTRQAEQWLENLDPYSDEGMWFNQLAESYPSKLEAAISYLSTSE